MSLLLVFSCGVLVGVVWSEIGLTNWARRGLATAERNPTALQVPSDTKPKGRL